MDIKWNQTQFEDIQNMLTWLPFKQSRELLIILFNFEQDKSK